MALIEHLEKLRHFYKISQHKSINQAAAESGLSQAGLSKSLILLENELNCTLFIRSREGLTLTKEGLELLNTTKKILDETNEIDRRLRSLKASQFPKNLTIGMYDSIAVYFGLELQKYLKIVYPKVLMSLHTDSSHVLLEKIKNRIVDIAIGVNFKKYQSNELVYFPLFEDYFSFYVTPALKNQIHDLPLLLHESASGLESFKVDKLLSFDIRKNGYNFIQNFETLKILTTQGLGIGLLPTQVAKPLIKNNQLTLVDSNKKSHLIGKHEIGFLVRADIYKNFQSFTEDIYRLGHHWTKL